MAKPLALSYFRRVDGQAFVLDSASYLSSNIRTDFNAMQPKWFMRWKWRNDVDDSFIITRWLFM
ncbi:hypothetical protein [Chrysiogenes arsenatis]|uniref:hypothetical protein n=1 Tax=Chrysiogenes arsenatis TaxID=309797 RepID=UPI00126885FA|nr:hypothetical protein [Chrysiogenes arsenatis]